MRKQTKHKFSIDEHIASIVEVGVWRCWKLDKKASSSGGYSQIDVNGVRMMAHRVIYELLIGDIPRGLHLDHLCRNSWCVHPNHLCPVTCKINVQRGAVIFNGQHQRARTVCPKGHPLSGRNVIYNKRGWRKCRKCKNNRAVEYYNRTKKIRNEYSRRVYKARKKLYTQLGLKTSVYFSMKDLQGLTKTAALERGAKDHA